MHTPHIHVRNTLIVRHSQGKLTPEIQSQFITRNWISWGRRDGQWAKCLPHKPENLSSCLLPSHIKMGVLVHDCDTSPGEETGGPIELQAPDSLRGHVSKSKLELDWRRHLASASGTGVHACTHMGMRKRAFTHTQTHWVGTINLLYRQIKGRKGIKLSQRTKASDKIERLFLVIPQYNWAPIWIKMTPAGLSRVSLLGSMACLEQEGLGRRKCVARRWVLRSQMLKPHPVWQFSSCWLWITM